MPNARKSKSNRVKKSQKGDGDVPSNRKVDILTQSVAIMRPPKTYSFIQTLPSSIATPIIGSAAANVTGGFAFALNNLNQDASFQALFDQYQIVAVDFTVRPRCNAFVATATSSPPPLYLVIDYDNVTALSSAAQATEFSTCAIVEVYQSCRRVFKPRLAAAAYATAGAGFTGYLNTTGWVDSAYDTVQHYGVKWFLPQCTASFTPEWDLDIKLHLMFRNII